MAGPAHNKTFKFLTALFNQERMKKKNIFNLKILFFLFVFLQKWLTEETQHVSSYENDDIYYDIASNFI